MAAKLSQYELQAVADCINKIETMTTGYASAEVYAHVVSAVIQIGDEAELRVSVSYDESGTLVLDSLYG